MDLISREATASELEKHKYSREYCVDHKIDFAMDMGMVRIVVGSMPSAFEGMTNGEVFRAIFPNASVYENQDNEPYPYIDVFLCGDKDMNCYRKDWWNAPYTGVSE